MSSIHYTREIYIKGLSRRQFLKLSALTAMVSASPCLSLATTDGFQSQERSLSFYHTHTRESLKSTYWAEGKYLTEGLAGINQILRDHRSGEVKPIDTRLLDLVYAIAAKLEARKPFHVISGYRSPSTNALLRELGRGVAKYSLHMSGKAVDIRLPGCPLSSLRRVAMDLKGGGVGYYPRPKFVHVDIGRVRYW